MIEYNINKQITVEEFKSLLESSGITRPTKDIPRLQKMLDNANLIITAWDGDTLVGIARSLTDFSYACYISDLAVCKEYQSKGIGKELINQTQKLLGDEVSLVLLSAPSAMKYYPKIGFSKAENSFLIKRKK